MLETPVLYTKVAAYAIVVLWAEIRRALKAAIIRRQALWFGSSTAATRSRNIVIVGASFAGYHAARLIARHLSPHSPYRVVVIEPNSHFQFTWVLPRFCVVPGHEHKAFIPYGGNVADVIDGALRWVKDRVVSIDRAAVHLEGSDERIPYDYLVIATGSGVQDGLPSRVNATDKLEGMKRLQAMQRGIADAKTVVVVGGGAAGVEVATDAKALYPEKHIILVHSRSAVMHRFGKGLQVAAREGLERLGVELVLEERVVGEDSASGTVTLQSGREIKCDFYVSLEPNIHPLRILIILLYIKQADIFSTDELCRSKASIRHHLQPLTKRNRLHRPHQSQAHSPNRRRNPPQHLHMRRRSRHQNPKPKFSVGDAAGLRRGGQYPPRGDGESTEL